jgi:hypothetical protein
MAGTLAAERQAAVTTKRGYYRIPKKSPANRVEGPLAEMVRAKFAEGWPKARIAREFRLNRRTVIRICAPLAKHKFLIPRLRFDPPVRCIGCGAEVRKTTLREHWPNCPAVWEGRFSLNDCPI